MKRLTQAIITSAILMLSSQLQAQNLCTEELVGDTYSITGFYFGARIAPQLSWMVNQDDLNDEYFETRQKVAASLGLAAGYNFSEHLGIETNLIYSLQGQSYQYKGIEYNQKVNYVKIPVMFTYTSSSSPIMFLGKVGPQLNILTKAKIDPVPVITGEAITNNNEARYESMVLGGVLSLGGRYALTHNLFVDASLRYDISFTNVEDKAYKYYTADRADTYNMTAGIELGVNYMLR